MPRRQVTERQGWESSTVSAATESWSGMWRLRGRPRPATGKVISNGVQHYLWRAADHEGEVPKAYVSKHREKKAALRILRKLMKRHGQPARS